MVAEVYDVDHKYPCAGGCSRRFPNQGTTCGTCATAQQRKNRPLLSDEEHEAREERETPRE